MLSSRPLLAFFFLRLASHRVVVCSGAQQQQYAGAQHETTSMAVQHALEAQQAAQYVATLEQHNAQQQQVRDCRLSFLCPSSFTS